METVARQLVRAIRAHRSQEAFSRRLGYTSNPVADWEAGRRFPTAAETLRACRLAGIDVGTAVARFTPEEAALLADGEDDQVAAWLSALRGNLAIKELAERVGQSRYAVARWLSGETRPRLPEFLALVDGLTNRLSDLVAELVPIEAVPALLERHQQRHASRRIVFEEPWVAMVMVVLETSAYQALGAHRDGWIAEHLGIPLETEQRCLGRLVAGGLIALQDGLYRTRDQLTIDARADPEGTKRLKAHWASIGAERAIAGPREGDLVSYHVAAVSVQDVERIREAHVRYFMEVRSILANSPPEVAVLVNIQLLTWGPQG
jgi:transcriptional regulator with XRE-family HTH domain